MKKIFSILLVAAIFAACSDDWLEVDPSTSMTPEVAFRSLEDAQVALRGVYNTLWTRTSNATYYGADIYTYGDVKGDDMRTQSSGLRTEQQYNFTEAEEASTWGLWTRPFVGLSNVNAILEKVSEIEAVTEQQKVLKADIEGQSLALRALFHFDLARIFGRMPANGNPETDLAVPLVTRMMSPAYNPARNTVAEVYAQIIRDLYDAIPKLSTQRKTDGTINAWAAKALLCRVQLYYGNYSQALELAEDVIQNGPYSLIAYDEYVDSWATAFSVESLFEIAFNAQQNSDREGLGYLLDPTGYGSVTLTDSFIDMILEDEDDIRTQIVMFDSRDNRRGYLNKYPGLNGASTRINNPKVIRLAEVYLIASEAALATGDQAKADGYLNALYDIRTNRENNLSNVDMERILLERRKELVGEGHRFFDLMRLSKPVMRNGSDHFSSVLELQPDHHRAIQPIPDIEMNANPNMVQNPGY